jgi:hypothetical protein
MRFNNVAKTVLVATMAAELFTPHRDKAENHSVGAKNTAIQTQVAGSDIANVISSLTESFAKMAPPPEARMEDAKRMIGEADAAKTVAEIFSHHHTPPKPHHTPKGQSR